MQTALQRCEYVDLESFVAPLGPRPRAALEPCSIRVLLVEDDPADANMVMDVLQRHPNVGAATLFQAPDEALFQLAAGSYLPDLILLDIRMPKVNGFTFMEALARIPGARDTPVVILTTSRFMRDMEKARAHQARGYIVKPDCYRDLKSELDGAVKQAISGQWSF
jgi:CheY-like chemotaxis protein